jgi:hypothetical protein
MSFTVYYETGSLQRGTHRIHKTKHTRRADADAEAEVLSRTSGGFVSVMKSGVDVAIFRNGHCVWEYGHNGRGYSRASGGRRGPKP